MLSIKSLLTAAALAAVARAETIRITASGESFDPDTVEAKKDDIIEFHFDGGNHSVASGLYDYPCTPSDGGTGFFSGFIEADDGNNDVFRVKINDTEPIVFFSSQDTECNGGMVGIINANDDKTLDDYKERASQLADKGNSPSAPYGGELVDEGEADDNNNNDDDNNDDNNDSNDNSNDDNGDEGAANAFGVPVVGLLSAVAIAFALA